MIEWKLRLSVWLYFYRTRVRSLLFTNWLTDWLTHCCLVNLIDVTLACEDANSKLFDVVTVADVDDEDRVGNSLLQISKLRFGQKAKLLFRFGQDFDVEVEARFEAGQFFSADLLKRSWSWILVRILKLGLVKILKLTFYGEADVWLRFWSWCLVEILKMKFDQDLCLNLWYELNSRVRCAFGMFSILWYLHIHVLFTILTIFPTIFEPWGHHFSLLSILIF